MDCSMLGFSVLHYLLEFAQTHVHWVDDAIQPSHPLPPPFSSCLPSFPASGSFPMSQLFASGGQSIGASASVLPLRTDWFDLLIYDSLLFFTQLHFTKKMSFLSKCKLWEQTQPEYISRESFGCSGTSLFSHYWFQCWIDAGLREGV